MNKTTVAFTILANLRYAVRNCETVTIGGGQFGPDELKELVELIERAVNSENNK